MYDETLVQAIVKAAGSAFRELFSVHPGEYYYCSLLTTGEAFSPVIAAWSKEALAAWVAGSTIPGYVPKWSFAECPYYAFGESHFVPVQELFESRTVNIDSVDELWSTEYDIRLESMVEAMRRLDKMGLFGTGAARDSVVILVEVMPPDESNVKRAKELNPPVALKDWLIEAPK